MLKVAEQVTHRPISALCPSPCNPRGPVNPSDPAVIELMESIRQHGILQPLVCTPDGVVLIGHRRLAAARLLGLRDVPTIARAVADEAEALAIQLVENLQREDLSPVQEARAYKALLDRGRTQADICRQVGVSGGRIQARLAILRLQPTVQQLFERGELPLHAAPLLARVVEPHQQTRLAQLVAARRFTVDKLREIVDGGGGIRVLPKRSPGQSPKRPIEGEGDPDPVARVTRAAAMALLEARPTRAVTFAEILGLFDSVCGVCSDCGMHSLEDICLECPLPRLVGRLAEK